MGTPDFAVGILDTIVKANHTIVGVVTAPDKPSGRGRKLNESAVKKYAMANGLPILQPTNLKSEAFLKDLKDLNANLQVVVAFRMLPKAVWQMPKLGTFNLHASLLPDYRGAAPINWAIINGETKTGVTTFLIDEKIDTGAIILQKETEIHADEDAGSLHDRLMVLGANAVLETLDRIANGNLGSKVQENTGDLKVAHKIHRDTCKIDWNLPMDDIYNMIRGLSPYPAAWSTLTDEGEPLDIKIYKVSKEKKAHDFKIGTLIVDKKELKVAVKNGFLNLLEIQLQGKRKMNVVDLLNGLNLSQNAKIG